MTKTRELSDFERGMVVATDTEKILKIPRTTCINIINNFERDQTVSNAPRSGRQGH